MGSYTINASLTQMVLMLQITKATSRDVTIHYGERMEAAELYHQINRKLGYVDPEAHRIKA